MQLQGYFRELWDLFKSEKMAINKSSLKDIQ
jgi:hypothetical protein